MLIEDLNEAVAVRADFSAGEITPRAFRRGERIYKVMAVNGRWVDHEGGLPRFCFSLQAGSETYFLSLRSADMVWKLEKVVLEG
jgi:hypothetical protein